MGTSLANIGMRRCDSMLSVHRMTREPASRLSTPTLSSTKSSDRITFRSIFSYRCSCLHSRIESLLMTWITRKAHAPIEMKVLRDKQLEVVETHFRQLFSNVLDGNIRLGDQPHRLLTGPRIDQALCGTRNHGRLPSPRWSLNKNETMGVGVTKDGLDGSPLRGVKLLGLRCNWKFCGSRT